MILASASPRRLELLRNAGFELVVEPAPIDEARLAHEAPVELVRRLAVEKAHATLGQHGPLASDEELLAADTIVWKGDEVLGKPADDADACRMLRLLSGGTHHVSTGVCLMRGKRESSFVETTDVTFRALTEEEIASYVATGETADKAGAYAIQGGAHGFVRSLDGDYDNVVGLPVARVLEELQKLRS